LLHDGQRGVAKESRGIKHTPGTAAELDGVSPRVWVRPPDDRLARRFGTGHGVLEGYEDEPMEVQDVALREPVVRVFDGYIKLASRAVLGAIMRRDRCDPVIDTYLAVK
jgi:hypothetical protein